MSLILRALLYFSRPSWAMACEGFVPSDFVHFPTQRHHPIKTTFKFFKRWLIFAAFGQLFLLRDKIPKGTRRVLWINQTAPSLGDALMDTSARVLLQGMEVHLLTASQNQSLFKRDPVFKAVYSGSTDAQAVHRREPFDLIILDSFSPKSLTRKLLCAPFTRFVGLYGFLNAYEVHRSIYSFRRIEHLLGSECRAKVRLTHGLPLMPPVIPFRENCIAIGVGGEWAFRTYGQWAEVLAGLLERNMSVVLVGSENGIVGAQDLVARFPSIVNLVAKTTLAEVASILAASKIYVGADGGLWHLASACMTPSVALHADCQIYDQRGNQVSRAAEVPAHVALFSDKDVSEISPSTILAAIDDLLLTLRS